MPANVVATIRAKVEQYAADPAALTNTVKALKGEPGVFRSRVSDWRALFTEDGEVLAVIRITPAAQPTNDDRQMNAQIIVTPIGERLVILPEADYLALVAASDDAGDREAVRRFRAALASGEEEALPSEMVDRILAGDSPVRVWREHRGLTAQALAEAAGLAQSYVSQIETGKRDGTVGTLVKLAGVLGVLVDDLIPVAPAA